MEIIENTSYWEYSEQDRTLSEEEFLVENLRILCKHTLEVVNPTCPNKHHTAYLEFRSVDGLLVVTGHYFESVVLSQLSEQEVTLLKAQGQRKFTKDFFLHRNVFGRHSQ